MNILNIMKFQIMPPRVILLSPNNIISIFLFGFANCVFTGQGIVMTINNAYDVINQDDDLEYDDDDDNAGGGEDDDDGVDGYAGHYRTV